MHLLTFSKEIGVCGEVDVDIVGLILVHPVEQVGRFAVKHLNIIDHSRSLAMFLQLIRFLCLRQKVRSFSKLIGKSV